MLEAAYNSSLKLLIKHNLRTIAFPCISTGTYGFPPASACKVALRTVRRFLERHGDRVDLVVFCLWGQDSLYKERLGIMFPSAPETETIKEAD